MPENRLDVLAIGDAIVDVIATTDDAFLIREDLPKGSMRVLDTEQATRLYSLMGPAREISGGSAANTMAGIAALGGRAGFVGQVAEDQLGEVFTHDIRAQGVEFVTPPIADGAPTGRCLILVTPDAQRTMNTFRGAAHELSADAIDPDQVRSAAILYIEGYLWRSEGPRAAMRRAMGIAQDAGARVALTLSDVACIEQHRGDFLELMEEGKIDLLFANEAEITHLAELADIDEAIASVQDKVGLLVCTRGPKGALAVENGRRVEVRAMSDKVRDTTGAGDLFAAGVLAWCAKGRPIEEALRVGAIAAGEVISHFGARPEKDLKKLVKERLGC